MTFSTKTSSLASELPYWDFMTEPFDHVVLVDGSLVAGVSARLKDIECLSAEDVNQFTQHLRTALDSLSEGITVQFYLSVNSDYSTLLSAHANDRDPLAHPIVKAAALARDDELAGAVACGDLYRPTLSLFIRVPQKNREKLSVFKKHETFPEVSLAAYQETLEILDQNLDGLTSNLEASGIVCRRLSKADLVGHPYRFLNPKRSLSEPTPSLHVSNENEIPEDYLKNNDWLRDSSPREQLAFGDLSLNLEQFTLDSYLHRVVTLKSLPEVTVAGQLAGLLRMPFHYDLLLSFEIPPQSKELERLQRSRRMAHSLAVTNGAKASDLESESKLGATEELIRELLGSGQRIYSVQLSIVLRERATAEGGKVLHRKVREVLSRLRALQGAEGLEESVGAWTVARGTLPGAPIGLQRPRKMKTQTLADFLPVYGPQQGDKEPVVVFRNRQNGLLGFDSFDPELPNYNCLVTGSSGAGKSFLNNCILLQELAKGLRVFIIDIGGSYKKLTQALDGQYIEMNLSELSQLNPFHLHDPSKPPSDQKIKSLQAVIETMVAEEPQAKLPKLDRVLLEKAIIELYAAKREKGMVPVLSDLMNALAVSEEPSLITLGRLLYTWTGDRPFGRVLDGPGYLKSSANICTFDLKGLSSYPDLQAVMILILTDFLLMEVSSAEGRRKRIILDEAWELLKTPAAASFMEHCARTLRKSGAGITFITQGLEEIVASPIGPAILNNTATKFVLLQRGDSAVLADALKLNSQELTLIQSLTRKKGTFSEAFMIKGDGRQVLQIHPTPIEYWLSTSDASDMALTRFRGHLRSVLYGVHNARQQRTKAGTPQL
jgi:type IV secretory pathway VirB4 component